jgi:hypothetical protein
MKHIGRIALGIPLASMACTAVLAAWHSGMVDDEGGQIFQAYVETGDAEYPTDLRLQCLGDGQISVRYGYGSDMSADVELPSDGPLTFTFTIDETRWTIPMQLEEMDGAFAAYMPKTDSLFSGLASGSALSIDDPTGLYHPVRFTLEGSGRALGALRDSCR